MLSASGGECSSFVGVVAFKPELLLGQGQLDPGGLFLAEVLNHLDPGLF